jgi:hypothetical protein
MHNILRQDFKFIDLFFFIQTKLKLQIFNREYFNF